MAVTMTVDWPSSAIDRSRLRLCICRRNHALVERKHAKERSGDSLIASDLHRSLEWWRNAPPGMPPAMVDEFIARLKAGSTVRKLTLGLRRFGAGIVTSARFKKHCELHPDWAAAAWRISKANTHRGRSARLGSRTHCKFGHLFAGDNLFRTPEGWRRCRVCMEKSHSENRTVSEHQARRVVEALTDGRTIANITKSGPTYVLNNRALLLFRRKHPKFDRLVVRLSTANAKVHHAEAGARRAQVHRAPSIADHGVDIFLQIRSAVPTTLPAQIRDDVIGAMALEVAEGKLRPTDIRGGFVSMSLRNSVNSASTVRLSLDARLSEDGNATLFR